MTKDKFNWKILLCCGLFLWFVINLLQGIFTEIQEDETYYALFGEHLAWGYFDHPPMVALMTFLSSLLFSGTLGVRFCTIVLSSLSVWMMWKIIGNQQYEKPDKEKVLVFLTLVFSVVMFNVYGFVATPDGVLILFSALFLLVYQRYLKDNTWKNALLMGLLMACMIYSKYHAFLFLGLIVLSNFKLLKDGKFWVACLLALALLSPHILWQVNNDYPSFRYNLIQRNESFRWSYFFEYLPNQLLIFNPFTFGAVVYVLIRRNKSNGVADKTSLPYNRPSPPRRCSAFDRVNDMHGNQVFERGLRFIIIGFFFFFWLMAFRGHVEPHWTIVCVIPMVVLVYRKALTDEKLKKYTKYIILPSLLLVVAFRILLLTPLADRFGYHGKEKYYKAIEQVAGDRPVVFRGSFQQPSLYHYFTGKESSTLKCYYDRKTQFDIWQFDKDWMGQQVFVCSSDCGLSKVYHFENGEFNGFVATHFQSANRLFSDIKITNWKEGEMPNFHHGDTIQMDFYVYNPYSQPIDIHHNELDIHIKLEYLYTDDFSYCVYDDIEFFPPQTMYKGHLYTIVGDNIPCGKNRLALGLNDRIATFVTDGNYVDVVIAGCNR